MLGRLNEHCMSRQLEQLSALRKEADHLMERLHQAEEHAQQLDLDMAAAHKLAAQRKAEADKYAPTSFLPQFAMCEMAWRSLLWQVWHAPGLIGQQSQGPPMELLQQPPAA